MRSARKKKHRNKTVGRVKISTLISFLKMWLAKICVVLIVLVSVFKNGTGQEVFTSLLAKQLFEEAWRDLAPFKKTAIERLHGAVFGQGRAARSTDIVIFNKSNYTFKLRETSCVKGGWTNSLLPEYLIPAHASVVFGAQSYRFMTGVSSCRLRYKSPDRKASFEIGVNNPYIGRNWASGKGYNVEVISVVGSGYNNIVRFTVNDHFVKKNVTLIY